MDCNFLESLLILQCMTGTGFNQVDGKICIMQLMHHRSRTSNNLCLSRCPLLYGNSLVGNMDCILSRWSNLEVAVVPHEQDILYFMFESMPFSLWKLFSREYGLHFIWVEKLGSGCSATSSIIRVLQHQLCYWLLVNLLTLRSNLICCVDGYKQQCATFMMVVKCLNGNDMIVGCKELYAICLQFSSG